MIKKTYCKLIGIILLIILITNIFTISVFAEDNNIIDEINIKNEENNNIEIPIIEESLQITPEDNNILIDETNLNNQLEENKLLNLDENDIDLSEQNITPTIENENDINLLKENTTPIIENENDIDSLEKKTTPSIEEIEYPFVVTYHFYYKDRNNNWLDMPWSQTITSASFSASKAISYFNRYPIATITTPNTKYTFNQTWSGDLGTFSASDRVLINGQMFTESTELNFYANYEEEEISIPVATVHIRYLDFDGEWIEDILEEEIEPGVSWTLNKHAFDDNISGYEEVELDDVRYSFIGWDNSLPLTIKNLKKDTDYYFTAQYKQTEVINITVNCIDNVAHGSSSWNNKNTFVSYTHTFKEPADIPEGYTFMYWEDADGISYFEDEELTIYVDDFEKDTVLNFVAVYTYQPQVQVTYHYEDNETDIITSDDYIDIYDEAPISEIWFYSNNNKQVPEGTIVEADEEIWTITPVKQNIKTYSVYVKYFTVTFNPGAYPNFEPETYIVSYGSETPEPPYIYDEDDYTFVRWSPKIADIVTKNMTYTAQWKTTTHSSPNYPTPIVIIQPTPQPTPSIQPSPPLPSLEPIIPDRSINNIEENNVPLIQPTTEVWAFFNLICLIATIFTLLKLDERKYNILTPIIVLAGLILFIYTENIHNPMTFIDQWTIWQLLVYIVSLLTRILTKKHAKDEEITSDV